MLILASTLSLFSVILYHNFKRSLAEDIDNRLRSKAEGVADAIDTYWETEKLEAQKDGVNMEAFSKINNINFAKIAQRWVKEKSSDPQLINIIVQVFNIKGEQITSSKNISDKAIFSKKMFDSALSGNSCFKNFVLEPSEKRASLVRTFAMPVVENDKIAYIVQISTPLSSINSALNRLKFMLLALLPITVLLTGIVGVLLVKLTLNPVDNMIRTLRQITAESLKLRVNVPDTRDEIERLAETFNDMITRLDNSFSSQKQFIQDISHELKTPLTILKGQLDVTLKKIRSQAEYEAVLVSSLEEIDRMNRIVENLLVFAKFDNKEISLKSERLDLSHFIEDVLDDIKILAEQKNIAINFIPGEKIMLKIDKNQMRQAVLNILDNAIKYTSNNGEVALEARKDGNLAKIKISDTGIGMPENELPHIFDRFYRVDKSRSSHGFGLGLSIAKSIVEMHKGKIGVESRLAKGSAFIISLPISP